MGIDYATLLAALTNARADTEIRVRSKNAEYVVTGADVELDLGPHLTPDDIPDPGPDPDPANPESTPAHVRALREPLLRQRREIADCDGNCTEHRAQLSDKRVVWLTVERA